MRATLLSLNSGREILRCSGQQIEYLKLFVFNDLGARAKHCSLTHHGELCPVIRQYIEKMHKSG